MKAPFSKLKRFTALSSALLLSACATLGPNHQTPKVDWVADWQPDLYGQAVKSGSAADLHLGRWWRIFQDPILDRLIDEARAASPSMHLAGLRVLESRALLGIADSSRFPQVQQGVGSATYVNSQRFGGDVNGPDLSQVNLQAGFNLGWELDFWGKFQRAIESADAAYFASIANQQNVQVLLSAQVASAYFTYRTTVLRIAIARENAEIQKRSYEISEAMFRSGQDSELNLQQAKTQYLGTLSTIPALESGAQKARNALSALLGRSPGKLQQLADPESNYRLPSTDQSAIRDVPSRLMLRRPDIRAAAWTAAAQSAQIGIAEADFYPSITLLGSLGLSGNTASGSAYNATLGLGPSLKWNLFDHGAIANNVRLQDARLQQLIENYRLTVLKAAREIDDAAVSVIKTREQQKILDDSVKASKRALELANKLYREGYVDFQRVLDAQRALFAQADRQLSTQGEHVNAVVSLYQSLGGGWTPTDNNELIPTETREQMRQRTDWGPLLDAPMPDENPEQAPAMKDTSE